MIKYLKCKISKGIIPSQKKIEFNDIHGNPVSGFFSDSVIKKNRLEVNIVKKEKGKSLIKPAIFGWDYEFDVYPWTEDIYVNNNLLLNKV